MVAPTDVLHFVLVFVRVAAMAIVLPNLAQSFPMRLRIGLASVIAVIVAPLVGHAQPAVTIADALVERLVEQCFWGAFLGGLIRLWVSSFAIAGAWISQVVGWGTGDTCEDGQEQAPALAQFHGWLGGLTFLAMDGPNMAIRALLDSFLAIPLSQSSLKLVATSELATSALTESLWLSLRIGSPVLTSVVASSIALAAIQRALPHLHLVRFQVAGNWLVLLVAFWVSVGMNADHWKQNVAGLMRNLPVAWAAHSASSE